MKTYTVILDKDTVVQVDSENIEEGNTITGTLHDENGKKISKTGTVTEILDVTEWN